jgi:prepilin-type N-terminal cleavage/methylation domain-containing protein
VIEIRSRRPLAAVRSASHPRASETAGFTLLEITVVLFILGMLLTLVFPHIGGFRNARLKSEARKLAGRANLLYHTAAARKMVMRLSFDIDGNGYFVSRLDPYSPDPSFLPDIDARNAPVRLPQGVRLRDVTVEGIGTVSRGTASCLFYPSGFVDPTVVHLENDTGTVFTLRFDPLTGRVQIARGDFAATAIVGTAR